ncbi:HAD family hydrolase [Streptomyces cylindrosporus]|uniref:Cof-type HAD-IIB family hydrolase n=1 Tax=Streptomyces cylindrosporus TaxID=2927583 RepID=A0ABS9YC86_9ACTN|nr:HAD family hydrolase [Streptomyces cylindrosporus]MCI3273511.1 Cof-type HAD-IIB family hydrolase [Streptomyces cylindrosporus]
MGGRGVIRILFCALDGTRIRAGNRVLDEDIAMLREATACGVRLVFVTGRPSRCLADLPSAVTELSGEVVTSNGACEIVGGGTRLLAPLAGRWVREFAEALRAADPKVGFATEFEWAFGFEPGYAWWPATDTGADSVCADMPHLTGGSLSITKLLCRSTDLDAGRLARTAEALGFDATVTCSCRPEEGGPVEVLSPRASKGNALRWNLDEAGIAPAAAVAFGDRFNDIPMLASVGASVVIGTASEPRLAVFESAASVGTWLAAHQDRWRGRLGT